MKGYRPYSIKVFLVWLLALAANLFCVCGVPAAEKGLPFQYIDVHNHLFGQAPWRSGMNFDYEGATETALARMDALGVRQAVIVPHPFAYGQPFPYDFPDFIVEVRKHPERLAFMGGGGTLNVMINRSFREGKLTPEMAKEFEETAEKIASSGAVGFGEMSAEHFSLGDRHPYQSTPPDHPLFLSLADIAAKHGMVIDMHMEAVTKEMPTPARLKSPNNPKSLRPNIEAFERLLAHNRGAKIIWAHAGWDNTGGRTVSLMMELLKKHPNLYMSIKIGRDSLPENRPVDETGPKPEWLELLKRFPDRFLIGSDEFFVSPRFAFPSPSRLEATHRLLLLLPPEIACRIGCENPANILRLKR